MKTIQQLASRLFLGVLLFAAGAAHAQFTYITNNGTITITGYTGPGGAVTIPSTINGLPVTDIGTNAFAGSALASVVIPDSVTNIGSGAFEYCGSLTNVTISLGVSDIGSNAFYGVGGLTSVTIPDSVTSIGAGAFQGCYGLTNVTIGNSVTNLGAGVFEDCRALTAINVAPGNPAYSSVAGVLFNQSQTTLVQYPEARAGSYIIPDTVSAIPDYAFSDCFNLTSVTMGSNVVSIGNYAFSGSVLEAYQDGSYYLDIRFSRGCPLTSVTIPNSVTTIGDFAFLSCNLTNILIGSGVTNIGEGAFCGCPLTGFDVVPGNPAYTSLDGVLFTHDQCTLLAFHCGLGGSYTIPNSVTNIGDFAFYGCTSLTNVVLDNNLISIGASAFSGPAVLVGLGPPETVGCPLTSITVPASITTIGGGAFLGCQSLTSAYFLGNAPSADSTVFNNGSFFYGESAYYLPGTTGWAEFATNTDVPTALWTLPYPLVLNGSSAVQANQFGFTISWATNVHVVVEASTDLSNPVWTPVATNALSSGTSSFTDPDWTNYPNRFYRLHSQ